MRYAFASSSTGSRPQPEALDLSGLYALRPLISCKDASRLISQMQDDDLSFGQRLRVRLHLLFCDACTRFERQLRFLHRLMQRYKE